MPSDHLGFYPNQCVAWVALKVNQMWGTKRTFWNKMYGSGDNRLGSAKHWKEVLTRNGYVADKNPQPGDIMWWERTNTDSGIENGHVAFVHKVEGDIIHYSEYNGQSPLKYSSVTVNRNSTKAEFIHIQQRR